MHRKRGVHLMCIRRIYERSAVHFGDSMSTSWWWQVMLTSLPGGTVRLQLYSYR